MFQVTPHTIKNIFLSLKYLSCLIFCLFSLFCFLHGCVIGALQISSFSGGIYPCPFVPQNPLIIGVDLEFCIIKFLLTFKVMFFCILSQLSLLLTSFFYDFVSSEFFISTFCFLCQGQVEMLSKIFPRLILQKHNLISYGRIQLLNLVINVHLFNKIIFEKGMTVFEHSKYAHKRHMKIYKHFLGNI